jgi:hypothetical protein
VQSSGNQLTPRAPASRILKVFAALLELADKVLGLSNVETALVVIELNIVGEQRSKSHRVARTFKEQFEERSVGFLDLASQLGLIGNLYRLDGRWRGDNGSGEEDKQGHGAFLLY